MEVGLQLAGSGSLFQSKALLRRVNCKKPSHVAGSGDFGGDNVCVCTKLYYALPCYFAIVHVLQCDPAIQYCVQCQFVGLNLDCCSVNLHARKVSLRVACQDSKWVYERIKEAASMCILTTQ